MTHVTGARTRESREGCTHSTPHGGARVLTFEAVLTGGGPLRFFLYPQYDTIARDHPILGGYQPAGARIHFQTSLAFTRASALGVARHSASQMHFSRRVLEIGRHAGTTNLFMFTNKTWSVLWILSGSLKTDYGHYYILKLVNSCKHWRCLRFIAVLSDDWTFLFLFLNLLYRVR